MFKAELAGDCMAVNIWPLTVMIPVRSVEELFAVAR
jgi:hypothetical protein